MIGLGKKAIVEGIHALGTTWNCFAFSGTVPTQESELPFNLQDDALLFNNCKAVFRLNGELRGDHIKYTNLGPLAEYKGVSINEGTLGYKVTPNTVNTNLDFGLQDRALLVGDTLSGAFNVAVDDYIELMFDTCVLQSVVVNTSTGNMAGAIEYYDGSTWNALDTLLGGTSNTYGGQGVTASGIRVKATEPDSWSVKGIEVYATGASSAPSAKSTISWVVLMPDDASSLGAIADTFYPFIFLPVGGPNAAQPMMLNEVDPEYGQVVKLLYFTLGANVLDI